MDETIENVLVVAGAIAIAYALLCWEVGYG